MAIGWNEVAFEGKQSKVAGSSRSQLTQRLVRVGSGRVDWVLDRRLILLNRNERLAGTAGVLVVSGIAGGDAFGAGVVLGFVLVVDGRHSTRGSMCYRRVFWSWSIIVD